LAHREYAKEFAQCANPDLFVVSSHKEDALAALDCAGNSRGKKYCRYHKSNSHDTRECHTYNSAGEKQDLPKKKKNTGKCKGKEKAHNTYSTDEEEGDDMDIDSHHVKFKKCLATSVVNFSDYTQHDSNSFTPQGNPSGTESATYLANTTQRPVIIIDSGTSSHIHANNITIMRASQWWWSAMMMVPC